MMRGLISIGEEKYTIQQRLHSTDISQVFLVANQATYERCIIKICQTQEYHQNEARIYDMLKGFRGNILQVVEYRDITIELQGVPGRIVNCLMSQYYQQGDLEQFAHSVWFMRGLVFKMKNIRFILHSILNAMKNLRRVGYAHGDIKPKNILVDIDMRVQISQILLADLGNVRQLQNPVAFSGTPVWSDPAVVNNQIPYAPEQSDIFSLGMVLLFLFMGLKSQQLIQFVQSHYGGINFWQAVQDRANRPLGDLRQVLEHTVCPAYIRWSMDRIADSRFTLNQITSDGRSFIQHLLDPNPDTADSLYLSN